MNNFSKILCLTALMAFVFACKKDPRLAPKVVFKTTAGYVFADQILPRDTTVKVGVIVDKVEDDLESYNVSVAYDAQTSTTTKFNFGINGTHYEQDVDVKVRNQAGTERWFFSVSDADGNITHDTLTFTIQ